jgi:hypothetical protein
VARITPTEAINRGGFFAKGVFFGRTVTKGTKASGHHLGGAGYKGAMFKPREAITPLFLLRKSVNVPARLGAGKLWNDMAPELMASLDQSAQRVITGAGL